MVLAVLKEYESVMDEQRSGRPTSITSQKRAPLLPTMLFHHDNAPSHQASTTQETIDRRSIEVLGHPPYSPDLAPCDFFLFLTLKKILRGPQFDDVADLQRGCSLRSLPLEHPHTELFLVMG